MSKSSRVSGGSQSIDQAGSSDCAGSSSVAASHGARWQRITFVPPGNTDNRPNIVPGVYCDRHSNAFPATAKVPNPDVLTGARVVTLRRVNQSCPVHGGAFTPKEPVYVQTSDVPYCATSSAGSCLDTRTFANGTHNPLQHGRNRVVTTETRHVQHVSNTFNISGCNAWDAKNYGKPFIQATAHAHVNVAARQRYTTIEVSAVYHNESNKSMTKQTTCDKTEMTIKKSEHVCVGRKNLTTLSSSSATAATDERRTVSGPVGSRQTNTEQTGQRRSRFTPSPRRCGTFNDDRSFVGTTGVTRVGETVSEHTTNLQRPPHASHRCPTSSAVGDSSTAKSSLVASKRNEIRPRVADLINVFEPHVDQRRRRSKNAKSKSIDAYIPRQDRSDSYEHNVSGHGVDDVSRGMTPVDHGYTGGIAGNIDLCVPRNPQKDVNSSETANTNYTLQVADHESRHVSRTQRHTPEDASCCSAPRDANPCSSFKRNMSGSEQQNTRVDKYCSAKVKDPIKRKQFDGGAEVEWNQLHKDTIHNDCIVDGVVHNVGYPSSVLDHVPVSSRMSDSASKCHDKHGDVGVNPSSVIDHRPVSSRMSDSASKCHDKHGDVGVKPSSAFDRRPASSRMSDSASKCHDKHGDVGVNPSSAFDHRPVSSRMSDSASKCHDKHGDVGVNPSSVLDHRPVSSRMGALGSRYHDKHGDVGVNRSSAFDHRPVSSRMSDSANRCHDKHDDVDGYSLSVQLKPTKPDTKEHCTEPCTQTTSNGQQDRGCWPRVDHNSDSGAWCFVNESTKTPTRDLHSYDESKDEDATAVLPTTCGALEYRSYSEQTSASSTKTRPDCPAGCASRSTEVIHRNLPRVNSKSTTHSLSALETKSDLKPRTHQLPRNVVNSDIVIRENETTGQIETGQLVRDGKDYAGAQADVCRNTRHDSRGLGQLCGDGTHPAPTQTCAGTWGKLMNELKSRVADKETTTNRSTNHQNDMLRSDVATDSVPVSCGAKHEDETHLIDDTVQVSYRAKHEDDIFFIDDTTSCPLLKCVRESLDEIIGQPCTRSCQGVNSQQERSTRSDVTAVEIQQRPTSCQEMTNSKSHEKSEVLCEEAYTDSDNIDDISAAVERKLGELKTFVEYMRQHNASSLKDKSDKWESNSIDGRTRNSEREVMGTDVHDCSTQRTHEAIASIREFVEHGYWNTSLSLTAECALHSNRCSRYDVETNKEDLLIRSANHVETLAMTQYSKHEVKEASEEDCDDPPDTSGDLHKIACLLSPNNSVGDDLNNSSNNMNDGRSLSSTSISSPEVAGLLNESQNANDGLQANAPVFRSTWSPTIGQHRPAPVSYARPSTSDNRPPSRGPYACSGCRSNSDRNHDRTQVRGGGTDIPGLRERLSALQQAEQRSQNQRPFFSEQTLPTQKPFVSPAPTTHPQLQFLPPSPPPSPSLAEMAYTQGLLAMASGQTGYAPPPSAIPHAGMAYSQPSPTLPQAGMAYSQPPPTMPQAGMAYSQPPPTLPQAGMAYSQPPPTLPQAGMAYSQPPPTMPQAGMAYSQTSPTLPHVGMAYSPPLPTIPQAGMAYSQMPHTIPQVGMTYVQPPPAMMPGQVGYFQYPTAMTADQLEYLRMSQAPIGSTERHSAFSRPHKKHTHLRQEAISSPPRFGPRPEHRFQRSTGFIAPSPQLQEPTLSGSSSESDPVQVERRHSSTARIVSDTLKGAEYSVMYMCDPKCPEIIRKLAIIPNHCLHDHRLCVSRIKEEERHRKHQYEGPDDSISRSPRRKEHAHRGARDVYQKETKSSVPRTITLTDKYGVKRRLILKRRRKDRAWMMPRRRRHSRDYERHGYRHQETSADRSYPRWGSSEDYDPRDRFPRTEYGSRRPVYPEECGPPYPFISGEHDRSWGFSVEQDPRRVLFGGQNGPSRVPSDGNVVVKKHVSHKRDIKEDTQTEPSATSTSSSSSPPPPPTHVDERRVDARNDSNVEKRKKKEKRKVKMKKASKKAFVSRLLFPTPMSATEPANVSGPCRRQSRADAEPDLHDDYMWPASSPGAEAPTPGRLDKTRQRSRTKKRPSSVPSTISRRPTPSNIDDTDDEGGERSRHKDRKVHKRRRRPITSDTTPVRGRRRSTADGEEPASPPRPPGPPRRPSGRRPMKARPAGRGKIPANVQKFLFSASPRLPPPPEVGVTSSERLAARRATPYPGSLQKPLFPGGVTEPGSRRRPSAVNRADSKQSHGSRQSKNGNSKHARFVIPPAVADNSRIVPITKIYSPRGSVTIWKGESDVTDPRRSPSRSSQRYQQKTQVNDGRRKSTGRRSVSQTTMRSANSKEKVRRQCSTRTLLVLRHFSLHSNLKENYFMFQCNFKNNLLYVSMTY